MVVSCDQAARKTLPEAAVILNVDLTEEAIEVFARFCRLLLAANAEFNLTAITHPAEAMRKHVVDSLTVVRYLGSKSVSIVDIGTGAGLPGLAVAVVRPDCLVTLVDSVGKKLRFASNAAAEMCLKNVEIVHARAEDFGRGAGRDAFDVCLARAVAPTSILLEYCAPVVRPGGRMFLYKNGNAAAEERDAERAAGSLESRFRAIHAVPAKLNLGADRFLLEIEKLRATPSRFPRRTGLARAKPL